MATSYDTACQQGAQCDRQQLQWQSLIRTKHSGICQLVSTRTDTCYCGMDQYGVCTERYKEDLSTIYQAFATATTQTTRHNSYAFLSQHGGPGAWLFIPYHFSHIPVPKQMRLALESQELQLYPKHLNKEQRYSHVHTKKVTKGRAVNRKNAARAARLPRANWNNRGETPVRLQLVHASGLTPNVVASDLESAFSSAQSILFHSLLLQLANREHSPYSEPSGNPSVLLALWY